VAYVGLFERRGTIFPGVKKRLAFLKKTGNDCGKKGKCGGQYHWLFWFCCDKISITVPLQI
jgi:hypothetical protein